MIFPLKKGTNRIRRGILKHTYGPVRLNADGTPRNHQGWDFYAEDGTPFYACLSGFVEYVGPRGALGTVLLLRCDQHPVKGVAGPVWLLYAHLSRTEAFAGQTVSEGTLLGHTGNTGNASSMTGLDQHLHFELRTTPWPGLGLEGRLSPLRLFGVCPLNVAA